MANSKILQKSKDTKNDEFYTLWEDIADEIPRYREQLRDKRIICPCDWDESFEEALVYKEEGYVSPQDLFSEGGSIKQIDVEHSKEKLERDLNTVKCNFVKFLVSHAEAYGIKSISVSGYDPATGKGVRFQDVDYSNYDIVITNPPFSLFRDFIDTMFENNMKFLVIGPLNAISYKKIFSRIQTNELWLGYAKQMKGFVRPDGTLLLSKEAEGSVPRACKWYTNLDVSYRHDKMILTERYNPEDYPKYCNFDGIDAGKTQNIPYDYDGCIGVPISFLQKYNPDQFEILGSSGTLAGPAPEDLPKKLKGGPRFYTIQPNGEYKRHFEKLVIRNKEVYHDADDN